MPHPPARPRTSTPNVSAERVLSQLDGENAPDRDPEAREHLTDDIG